MTFELDNQTINDLDIFRSSSNQTSVFDYFDQTQTKGGQDALFQLMKSPTSEVDVLEFRIELIGFFRRTKTQIRFNAVQFDFIEHYLKLNIRALKDNFIDAYGKYVSNILKSNNDYHVISQGVRYLIDIIRTNSSVFDTLDLAKLPPELAKKISSVSELLEHKNLKSVSANKTELSPRQISKFDQLFRHKNKNNVRDILDLLYLFDAFNSVGKVYVENDMCLPEYMDSNQPEVSIKGLHHPLVRNALKNDFILEESQNVFFLTGPNMAGKSTLLKSIGLSVYLSHIGFPVCADSMKISVYNGLVTTINLSDDISKGYSHFYNEVKRVKETALKIKSHRKVFVICDELFRGTNVKDAFEGSTLIISSFLEIDQCTFVISSHITEVADNLKNRQKIQFKYLDSNLVENKPEFTYRLCSGISEARLGLYILMNEKITDILNEATSSDK